MNLTSLEIDLDLAVRKRKHEEIFSVCLFDRAYCLGHVTEYDGGGPMGLGAASLVSANTR